MMLGRDAVDGYVWLRTPSIRETSGPIRVKEDDPTDTPPPPFLGFTPPAHQEDQ